MEGLLNSVMIKARESCSHRLCIYTGNLRIQQLLSDILANLVATNIWVDLSCNGFNQITVYPNQVVSNFILFLVVVV